MPLVEYGDQDDKLSNLSELLLPILNEECDEVFFNIVSSLNIRKK